jgi:hypothetical protein
VLKPGASRHPGPATHDGGQARLIWSPTVRFRTDANQRPIESTGRWFAHTASPTGADQAVSLAVEHLAIGLSVRVVVVARS